MKSLTSFLFKMLHMIVVSLTVNDARMNRKKGDEFIYASGKLKQHLRLPYSLIDQSNLIKPSQTP